METTDSQPVVKRLGTSLNYNSEKHNNGNNKHCLATTQLLSDKADREDQRNENDRELKRKARKLEKQEILGRGQLKLSITVSGENLIVYAQEAFGLKSDWRARCNAYVQAEICENDVTRSRPQTKVISGSNCPVFNEHLVHCLRPEDEKKRLLISVWHRDDERRCSEFLGCLSFGLRHLVAKCTRTQSKCSRTDSKCSRTEGNGVQGWYYLLSADVGHRKHLLASRGSCHQNGGQTVSDENKENQRNFEELTFTLKHRGEGYGFTVRGPHPTRVGRVRVGGPAQEAGLIKGDVIMQINGQPISNHDMQHVAHIIRYSPQFVGITVKRALKENVPILNKHINLTPTRPTCKISSSDMAEELYSQNKRRKLEAQSSLKNVQSMKNMHKISQSEFQSTTSLNCNQISTANICDKEQNVSTNQKLCNICRGDNPFRSRLSACEHVTYANDENNDTCSNNSSVSRNNKSHISAKWQPDISEISQEDQSNSRNGRFMDSMSSFDQHLLGLSHLASYKDLATLANEQYSCLSLNIAHQNSDLSRLSATDIKTTSSQHSISKINDVTTSSNDSMTSPVNESRLLDDATEFEHLLQTTFECSMASEKSIQRDICARTFVNCEENFVQLMQRGIQAYSRPLRVCITAQQKEVLFQNIEKLVALSRFNLTQLQPELTSLHEVTMDSTHAHSMQSQLPVSEIGHAYHSTISMLCGAYSEYMRGLGDAVKLLRTLLTQSDFTRLVQTQKQSCDLDLLDFLQQPVVHFEFMRRAFKELLSHADEQSVEYGHFTDILAQFQESLLTLV